VSDLGRCGIDISIGLVYWNIPGPGIAHNSEHCFGSEEQQSLLDVNQTAW